MYGYFRAAMRGNYSGQSRVSTLSMPYSAPLFVQNVLNNSIRFGDSKIQRYDFAIVDKFELKTVIDLINSDLI